MKTIKDILLYVWQLPQNVLGLILLLVYKPEKKLIANNGNYVYFSKYMPGGISLGKYSIINKYYLEDTDEETLNTAIVKHEAIGHGTQSLYLGPLYLIVIGLPSIMWAKIYPSERFPYTKNGYYKFYTEKSADKLGGVVRN